MRIFKAIRQAYISLVSDDTESFPTAQATHSGKATKYGRLSPYGLDSNPPTGAWVLLFSSQGKESTKFGIACDFLNRKKSLAEGEVVLYNTQTQSYVYLKANGDIEVDAKNDLVAIVAGDLSVSVTGSVDINSSTITLGSGGGHKALVTEDLLTLFTDHTHSGVETGSGSTGVPNTPATTEKTVNLKAT